MARSYSLILDAGTSSKRCYMFDETGDIAGSCARPWSYLPEEDASSLARAFDPNGLWESFCNLIVGAMENATASPSEITVIGVTSQRQAVVFLDKAGREIFAGPNLDLRAVFEGAAIDEEFGEEVYSTTGHLPSMFFTPAKLRWLQVHRADDYRRIASILTLADWLLWRLTGNLASELTLACEAGLIDVGRGDWCAALLTDLGLVSNTIPIVQAGTIGGMVSSKAAGETGLPEGTPVAVSGADTQCGLLGMGAALEGQVGIVAGWSVPLQMVTDRPILSPDRKTWAGFFPGGKKWVAESSGGDLGNSYRWLAGTLFGNESSSFDVMDALACTVPPGSEGVVAYLGATRMDMTKLGMRLGGFLFPVPLTFSDTGRGHLVRAALEAVAYTIKANLEQLEALVGAPAADIVIGGGMTRTPTFVRLLTDVIGRELRVSPTPQVSAFGAFLCCQTALGEFSSLEEAAASGKPRLETREPDPLDSAEYQDHYQQWVQLSTELLRLSAYG